MTTIFISYSLDWKGPEVYNFHLSEAEAKESAKGNQYLFVTDFEYPGDPLADREATLDFIQAKLWEDFVNG